ncbi:MAG: two-component system, NtrC family, sensor histidine kinase AtoS [Pyrinomonadaceae bacterium]|nr:two-component system, NtrC family, sensor histidine kinase AtoS [Pyrinomonadaceae bacterium]
MLHRTRYQFGLSLLAGFFLLATVFAILLYVLIPETPATRGPLLLAAYFAILLGCLLCIMFLLRRLLRPYRQLVGEAEKASLTAPANRSLDEGEFVLETFQSVVAQLQKQREVLEELRNEASKRAVSAERFSERIVASVPSALIAFDGNGRSIVINEPGRALLQVDGSALGQTAGTLLQNLPQLAQMVQQCLETGTLFRREEIEVVTGDRLPRRLGATIAPINISLEQNERGALCLLTDITEVTQLREQVALKKNLESLGEMSAGLAHEFKNAIAALQGYVQLLQNLELDERGATVAASLLGEVRNLSEMVTSFLNFARPQPLQLDEVNVNDLLAECADELRPLFAQLRVELVVNGTAITGTPGAITGTAGVPPADAAALIRADERMLRQALLNLIRNAAEAIPDSHPDRRVEVSTATERDQVGKWAVVEIADTGIGIPATDLHRIFIPFFTTKPTGHGVGLALAHRVITQHGGTLAAANATDGGAIFTLRLPA